MQLNLNSSVVCNHQMYPFAAVYKADLIPRVCVYQMNNTRCFYIICGVYIALSVVFPFARTYSKRDMLNSQNSLRKLNYLCLFEAYASIYEYIIYSKCVERLSEIRFYKNVYFTVLSPLFAVCNMPFNRILRIS